MPDLNLNGVHHISCITGDAPGNVEFYAGLLGMRMVKRTVNQDDPSVYHLFYGDEDGTPGFDLTFFEYPGASRGRAGRGMIHRILWRVGSEESLRYWRERLETAGIAAAIAETDSGDETTSGKSLRFEDREGLAHELLVYTGPDAPLTAAHREVPPEHAIQGFHGVRAYSGNEEATIRILEDVLGFEPDGANRWRLTGTGEDGDGGLAIRSGSYRLDPSPEERPLQGAGTVHHIAWSSPYAQHAAWRDRVNGAGLYVTPVIDRFYFLALYFREPGGVLFEIASAGPGFATDEDREHLGEALSLPPDFEGVRSKVEPHLRKLPDITRWRPSAGLPKSHPADG